jgi:hypothetical protein
VFVLTFLSILRKGSINETLVETMEPTCKLVVASENAKAFIASRMAKAGEGANHPQVRSANRKNRMRAKSETKRESIEETRNNMRARGVFLCQQRCPRTSRYCTGQFVHQATYNKHTMKGKHAWPMGIRAKDLILLEASRPGGLVSCGSRPDRQNHCFPLDSVVSAEEGAQGEEDARSFGSFNRKENQTAYRKPAKLLEVLRELYDIEPKLTAKAMRERMRAMRDCDGGLLFCISKRQTTGMLLIEDQIQSWINSETKQRKNRAKAIATEADLEESRLVSERS